MEKINSNQSPDEPKDKKLFKTNKNKRIATSAVFVGVGLILSYLNVFAYFTIAGSKINPYAHMINGMMGVLVGLSLACTTALAIAVLRFSLGIGSILAFPGGISGALITGTVSYILRKKKPKYVDYASLTDPIGTIFIGGTISDFLLPLYGVPTFEGILFWWGLFALSCIPGTILGFLMLKVLKKAGITWKDFF